MKLDGRTFGRLTVLGPGTRKGYVLCQCVCGKQKEIRQTSLTKQKEPTRSCGCIQRQAVSKIGSQDIAQNARKLRTDNLTFNTNFSSIETNRPFRNNTSGVKGVSWNGKRQRWEAYISIHGKRVFRGRYSQFEDAVAARKAAEQIYHAPVIRERNKPKEDTPCANSNAVSPET